MLRIGSIVWGVNDVASALRFWSEALGYRPRYEPDDDWVILEPVTGYGVQLALQQVKAAAAERRRHHLDLYARDQAAEVARLEGLGATRVEWRYEQDADYVVMADPDGNLFCVIEAGDAAADPGTRALEAAALPAALPEPDAFAYRGARALVILHERELRAFLPVWRAAKASGVPLPATSDEAYASYDALLRHVLRAAMRYLTWVCTHLELPDPGVAEAPPVESIAAEAESYLEHVLDRWRDPLKALPEERFEDATYTANWGVPMTIEAMLEHAVMHPQRHALQLRELMRERRRA